MYLLSLCCCMKHKLPLPGLFASLPLIKIIALVPVLTVLSHLLSYCVWVFHAGFSVLKEFTQSYTVKNLFSRLLKSCST